MAQPHSQLSSSERVARCPGPACSQQHSQTPHSFPPRRPALGQSPSAQAALQLPPPFSRWHARPAWQFPSLLLLRAWPSGTLLESNPIPMTTDTYKSLKLPHILPFPSITPRSRPSCFSPCFGFHRALAQTATAASHFLCLSKTRS